MRRSFLSFSVALLVAALAGGANATPSANDSCTSAAVIPATALPFTSTLDTTGGTEDPGDPAVTCVAPAPNKTVWYRIIPLKTETLFFDASRTTPSEYLPVISVYTGTCSGLAPVVGACGRGNLAVTLSEGTTYWVMVAGAPLTVDPVIVATINGQDACPPGGPGPGGDECGKEFTVKVGDVIQLVAVNAATQGPMPSRGTISWAFGAGASPATAEGASVTFTYQSASASVPVVLTYTPPTGSPITREITMHVEPASGTGAGIGTLAAPAPLSSEVAILPSEGGTLQLTVRRDTPNWKMTYAVASVARAANAYGSTYVSDVSVANLEASKTSIGFELWAPDGSHFSDFFELPAGGSRSFPDVIGKTFGLEETYGTLIIWATGTIVAGARTYAPAVGGGTNGQFAIAADISALQSAGLISGGQTGVFPAVRQDAAFRTNVGVFNISSIACAVELEARDEAGAKVGTTSSFSVSPSKYVQKSLGEATGAIPLASGSATVRNLTPGCYVGASAYVIDNVSQDPSAVAFRK